MVRAPGAARLPGVGLFLVTFARFFLFALWLLVIGRVVVSWVDPGGRNQISAFLIAATEPILAPVRRFLPSTGAIDFSPFVVVVVLSLIVRALG